MTFTFKYRQIFLFLIPLVWATSGLLTVWLFSSQFLKNELMKKVLFFIPIAWIVLVGTFLLISHFKKPNPHRFWVILWCGSLWMPILWHMIYELLDSGDLALSLILFMAVGSTFAILNASSLFFGLAPALAFFLFWILLKIIPLNVNSKIFQILIFLIFALCWEATLFLGLAMSTFRLG